VKSPFDHLVTSHTHFWNSSGVTASLEGGGFHIEFQSLQAIISGGITFDEPPQTDNIAPSPGNAVFRLYKSKDDADAAGYQNNIKIVSYFTSSVRGLMAGSPVDILGLQVGEVTGVALLVDPKTGATKVRVAMDLQPERVVSGAEIAQSGLSAQAFLQNMVNQGTRVELETISYVTGQMAITLAKVPNAPPAAITQEGDALVIPSQAGGLDNVIANLSDISTKLDKMPLQKIGEHLDMLLVTTNKAVGSPALTQTLKQLTVTLKTANTTLNGVNAGYGADSDFQRNLQQLMDEATDTLRSIKLLAAELQRDPQALLLGRSGH
jgi:paraquat-inducible protein B